MAGRRQKYAREDFSKALEILERGPEYPDSLGLSIWTRGGFLAGVEPRACIWPGIPNALNYDAWLPSVPNIPKPLLKQGFRDPIVGQWMVALSFQAVKFRGEFLISMLDPNANFDKWLEEAEGAARGLKGMEKHAKYLAGLMVEVEVTQKGPPSKGQAGKVNADPQQDDRYEYFEGLLRSALSLTHARVGEWKRDRPSIHGMREDMRRGLGLKGPKARASQSIKRVALYLWMRLRREGWNRAKASKALNEFLRSRRCGFRRPPPDDIWRSKEPPHPNSLCAIWPPSVRKGHKYRPTAKNFERLMDDELNKVLPPPNRNK